MMDDKKIILKIVLDSSGHVSSYASTGDIAGGQDYEGDIPEGFLDDPYPGRYLLQNGLLVVDPSFTEPAAPELPAGPSLGDQLVQVSQSLAKASFQLMTTQQQNEAMAKQNANMGFEIMQLKQQITAQPTTPTNGGTANV